MGAHGHPFHADVHGLGKVKTEQIIQLARPAGKCFGSCLFPMQNCLQRIRFFQPSVLICTSFGNKNQFVTHPLNRPLTSIHPLIHPLTSIHALIRPSFNPSIL